MGLVRVGFFRPANTLSRVQTWWVRGQFNHVGIILPVCGTDMILHSIPWRGVTLLPANTHAQPDVEFSLSWAHPPSCVSWGLQTLGLPYGWLDTLPFVRGRGKDLTSKDHVGQTCSEYVANFLIETLAAGTPPYPLHRRICSMYGRAHSVLPKEVYDVFDGIEPLRGKR